MSTDLVRQFEPATLAAAAAAGERGLTIRSASKMLRLGEHSTRRLLTALAFAGRLRERLSYPGTPGAPARVYVLADRAT